MTRAPDLPCCICGKLMWRTKTSLPAGEAMCHPCRRAGHSFKHGTDSAYRSGCRCEACREHQARRVRNYAERVREVHGVGPSTLQRRRFKSENGYWPQSAGGNSWINPRLRHELYERDGWICHLCELPIDRLADPNSDYAPSLDHLIPRSMGGLHDTDNLKTAHRICNAVRKDSPLVN